ncbi:MAG: hypothetical protein A2075_13240 [Geobacteraceae bacterium GWC2_58_44]|nr:MAG: hypothetical protein A2075_13240 [Geobacteraceae bacterium GWC2_58_44]HBG06372.1 hypothetical protein [Geobacter sp.]
MDAGMGGKRSCAMLVVAGLVLAGAVQAFAVNGNSLQLPRTGQNACYDNTGSSSSQLPSCAGTGQDGELRKGESWPNPRLTDNNDGTVTDNLTGLIWLRNVGCLTKSWAEALSSVKTLAASSCGLTDGSAAGDWRLPNINELRSILDLQNADPPLPAGHPFLGIPSHSYWWSSTSGSTAPNYAWLVSASSGIEGMSLKSYSKIAWAVRGSSSKIATTGQLLCYADDGSSRNPIACAGTGQDGELQKGVAWPSPRFTDRLNGTVTDELTGLIWLKNGSCFGLQSWANALTSVKGLTSPNQACGLSDGSVAGDWRLPNRTELASLTDSSAADNAPWLNDPAKGHFTGVQSDNYWTSSTDVSWASHAWTVDLGTFPIESHSKTPSLTYYVWAVKGGGSSTVSNLLSVSKVGNGTVTALPDIDCGATCSASYSPGTVVTLTAAAGANYGFSGWSGACSGTGSCQVTMNAAKNVTATFTANQADTFTVSVTIDGNGSGSVNSIPSGVISCSYPPPAGTCSSGQTPAGPVTLTATASGNSLFGGWGGACAGCSGSSCALTLDSNKSCSATFTTLAPARIAGNPPVYFTLLQDALAAATNGAIIQARAVSFPAHLTATRPGRVGLKGGYDGSFGARNGHSTLQGKLLIRSGTLVVDRFTLAAAPVPPVPAAPLQPTATPGDSRVSLSWGAVAGAASYALYYSSSPGLTKTGSTRIGGIAGTTYTVAPLPNGVPCYFRIAAANSGGEGALSPEQSATPGAQPPPAPSGISATSGDGQVVIGWNAVPGATSYNLYGSLTPDVTKDTGTLFAGVTSPCTLQQMANDVRYYFVVTAVNASGESVESNQTSGFPSVPIAPDMSSVPESLTPSQRDAAMDTVNLAWGNLYSGNLDADNQALVTYIRTLPDFGDAGISSDRTVWARFKDGFPVLFLTKTVAPGTVPGATVPAASAKKGTGAMPQGAKAVLVDVDLLATGALATIEPALKKKGYLPSRLAGSVEDFMSIKNVGVLFITSHGGTMTTKSGRPSYGVMTNEKITGYDAASAHSNNLRALYRSEELGMAGVLVNDTNGLLISLPGSFWQITEKFVRKNWTFTEDSLAVLSSCEMFRDLSPYAITSDAEYPDFRSALNGVGAAALLGWDGQVSPEFASEAMQLFFDRVLGANEPNAYQPEHPPQRPFPYKEVLDWMKANGRDVETDHHHARMILEEKTNFGQLVPSLVNALVVPPAPLSSGPWTLALNGTFFGPQGSGAGAGTVTVGNTQLVVSSWTETGEGGIVAQLPAMGSPGSFGDIVVEVRGHKSNAVPLTQWTGYVTQVRTKVMGGGRAEFRCPVRLTGDVHLFRTNPGSMPQRMTVMSVEVPQSCNYTFSGTWSDENGVPHTLSGSGTVPPVAIEAANGFFGNLFMPPGYISALPVDFMVNFFPGINPKASLDGSPVSVPWLTAPQTTTNRVTLEADYKLTGELNCKAPWDLSSATCTETWNGAPVGLSAPKADTQS